MNRILLQGIFERIQWTLSYATKVWYIFMQQQKINVVTNSFLTAELLTPHIVIRILTFTLEMLFFMV